ncbi:MAG TPA: GNAT family N-acetyltransferase [Armatimonadota bacterium]|nr:GNAT family N-acetyltransferase [Armatimonadota bacterium]
MTQEVANDNIEVCFRDRFSTHGEELIRSRYWLGVADHSLEWPRTGVTPEDFRDKEVIVAHIGGVVAGRAILDAVFYPLAELENLEVSPSFRSCGVGSAIVSHAIEAASRAGFLAIHVQTDKDNITAQRLYARHGFMPATRGQMLRVWRFLNLPVLSQFLRDHPMALLDSRQVSDQEHVLCWRDTGSEDELAVTIRGGSCQSDSNGLAPSVASLRLKTGSVKLTAALDADLEVKLGGAFSTRITLANEGANELAGGFRLGLNPGFEIVADYPGGEQFAIPPGTAVERSVTVRLASDFPVAILGICAYPSVPISVDFLLGDNTFWLATQTQVIQASGG